MENRSAEPGRAALFKRNDDFEPLLTSLNESLSAEEQRLLAKGDVSGSDHRRISIMGVLRSGTTLFMQWLANSGIVAYPYNLLSSLYGAPAIGSQIQLLFTDPHSDLRNESADFKRYSFKIPEYSKLRDLDPVVNAVGHVVYIKKAVTQWIGSIDQSRAMIVQYESFCEEPRRAFRELLHKLNLDETETAYVGPESVNISIKAEKLERQAIEDETAAFSAEVLPLGGRGAS